MGKILQFPNTQAPRFFWGLDALIYEAILESIPWNSQRFDRAVEETLLKIMESAQQERQNQ